MNFFRITGAALLLVAGTLLTLAVALLALPFFVFALLVRGLALAMEPRFIAWNEIIEFDPDLGWKPKSNLDDHYLTLPRDGVYRAVTDSQGWPGRGSLTESRMVVFGDSFASGYGIDNAKSFSEINPALRVKAIGAPAYNMVQELLLMRRFSAQLRGKLVVWFICVENDLIDNLSPHTFGYRTPFVRRTTERGWEIVTSHINRTKWHHIHRSRPYQGSYLEVLAKLCSTNPLSERAYSACEFLISEGKKVCSEAGSDLVVMTISNVNQLTRRGAAMLAQRSGSSETFDPEFPDKRIGGICDNLRITFMAARTFLDAGDYKKLDPHWNKRGHERVAKALDSLYQDRSRRGTDTVEQRAYTKSKLVEAR